MTGTIIYYWRNNAATVTKKIVNNIYCADSQYGKVTCIVESKARPKKKSFVVRIKFQVRDYLVLETKAKLAGCSINNYIRIATLESNYKPALNPALHIALLALNKELTIQGRSLNDILNQVNEHMPDSLQVMDAINSIRNPLIFTLRAIKNALVQGEPQP